MTREFRRKRCELQLDLADLSRFNCFSESVRFAPRVNRSFSSLSQEQSMKIKTRVRAGPAAGGRGCAGGVIVAVPLE